jgi:bifunctional non-homologous end joining protein LigD
VQGGRFRHSATFVRWREDRDPRSCTFEQVAGEPPQWWGDEG